MADLFQTKGPGGLVLKGSSSQLAEHITFAIGQARLGRRCWVKARTGARDDWWWSIEHAPLDNSTGIAIIPHCDTIAVSFGQPGNPDWINTAGVIAGRLCSPIPGGST